MTKYVVVYEKAADGGWGAYLPDVPGVVAAADSREEAERLVAEAVALYRDELARDGREMPAPTAEVGAVSL